MSLYKEKIIVAIENAVQQQVEASGVTSELHRLDGEKIVDAIMEQLEGFVLVPKEPTDAMLFAASGRDIVAEHYGDENILWPELRGTWKAMIEAQEPTND